MAKVTAAAAAMHFSAQHAKAFVLGRLDRALDRIVEARPACSAFKFSSGSKEPLAASGADKNAWPLFTKERAASRWLRPMPAHDAILFRSEKATPFFVGAGDFKVSVLHSLSPARQTNCAARVVASQKAVSALRCGWWSLSSFLKFRHSIVNRLSIPFHEVTKFDECG